MQELVSIIIPVYKVEERFLRNSIESAIGQSYTNIEILIVDDGSPDNCGIICDEYAEKDERVRVFHTENNGVSKARNIALDKASGKFVFFLDSDDLLVENAIELLVDVAENNNTDCVMCAHECISDDDSVITNTVKTACVRIEMERDEAIEYLCYMKQPYEGYDFGVVWGCLYKRELIDSIRFNERMSIGEDFEFKYRTFLHIDKLICIEDKLYKYLIRNTSAMRNGFDKRKLDSVYELVGLLESQGDDNTHIKALESRIANIAIVILFMIPIEEKYYDERKQIITFLKGVRHSVIINKNTRMKVRVSLILSYLGFNFVQKLFYFSKG